jgi:GDSL-like lipase/acylhydrolase family protein
VVAAAPTGSRSGHFAAALPGLRAMTRSIVQNLVLLGITLLVCLVGGEGLLRLFPQYLGEEAQLRLHWEALGRAKTDQSMTVPDPRVGFLYRPNFTGRISRGDFDFTFRTDEHGFRNPSPWPKRADVVVVGDSMAFGYGVDDEQAWPHLVTEALPATTIVNLGMIGAAPQQYLRILEAFGLDLRPKLVLFMLFPGNDLDDAQSFQQWLDADTGRSYGEWRSPSGQPASLGPLRQLLERSYLITFLRAARKSLAASVAAGAIEFEDGRRVQLVPAVYQTAAKAAHPGDPVFDLVLTTIERARDLTRERGGRFLVLLMPTKEEVYLPRLGEPAPPLVEAFKAALTKRGIGSIDLTPEFRARSEVAAPLFYEIDGHPNAEGCRLIAQVITDRLKEFGPS